MDIETVADRLGYDYTPIPNFPMPAYKTYGLHTKDYFFDRFTPRGPIQKLALILVRMMWWLIYILPLGLWLTLTGMLATSLKKFLLEATGRKTEVPENPYLDQD
jgi:ABC-type uncharacterized transport system permease subunit